MDEIIGFTETAPGDVFFVVTSHRRGKCYGIYYDYLPRELFKITPSLVIAKIKLDDAHRYLTLTELISLYEQGLLQ